MKRNAAIHKASDILFRKKRRECQVLIVPAFFAFLFMVYFVGYYDNHISNGELVESIQYINSVGYKK